MRVFWTKLSSYWLFYSDDMYYPRFRVLLHFTRRTLDTQRSHIGRSFCKPSLRKVWRVPTGHLPCSCLFRKGSSSIEKKRRRQCQTTSCLSSLPCMFSRPARSRHCCSDCTLRSIWLRSRSRSRWNRPSLRWPSLSSSRTSSRRSNGREFPLSPSRDQGRYRTPRWRYMR